MDGHIAGFEGMFLAASGREPGEWLVRAARDGLAASMRRPAGQAAGDLILAWLWRRLYGDDNSNRRGAGSPGVPRRLFYALPQGSIAPPVVADVRAWLERLDLTGTVAVHVSMGTWADSQGPDWREDMHRPAIVIGTSEVLVSKAINRGFGVGPTMWPIDFALATNGAQWILPDARLSRQAAATLRRIEAAARHYGTAEPLRMTEVEVDGEGRDVGDGEMPRRGGAERAERAERRARSAAVAELSPPDVLELFDTSPGAGPSPLELACEHPDLDVAAVWATWTAGPDGEPDAEVRVPGAAYRCAVPLSAVGELARDHQVWRRTADGTWARVVDSGDLRPFEVLLVDAAGYSPDVEAPVLRTPAEATDLGAAAAGERAWQSLDEHSGQVRDQAAALLSVLRPAISEAAWRSVVVAGWLHDAGKGHPVWQDALCALAPSPDRAFVAGGRPWAKSGSGADGRLEFADGVSFRHELASLLLLDGPLRSLLAMAPDRDLCRYLVLAHHGILRMRITGDGEPESPCRAILGLEHGATTEIPPMLGLAASRLTVDLAQFDGDFGGAWRQTVAALLERYGPYRLAFMEMAVRIADWRASGSRELPT